MSFTNAAYEILRQAKKPLSAREIFELALKAGLVQTNGKTPQHTMRASLYLENKRRKQRGQRTRFVELKNNHWALSEWVSE